MIPTIYVKKVLFLFVYLPTHICFYSIIISMSIERLVISKNVLTSTRFWCRMEKFTFVIAIGNNIGDILYLQPHLRQFYTNAIWLGRKSHCSIYSEKYDKVRILIICFHNKKCIWNVYSILMLCIGNSSNA